MQIYSFFEQFQKGMAGKTLPKPKVALMAHLYWAMSPSTLKPKDAGFWEMSRILHWQSRLIQTSMTRHWGLEQPVHADDGIIFS